MAVVDAADVMQLWEDNRDRDELSRSVALSAIADPPLAFPDAAGLAIGQRNSRMLQLRQRWTDEELEVTAQCPDCETQLEFTVDPVRLIEAAPADPPRPAITIGDTTIHWRAVTSRDLSAAGREPDAEQAGTFLLRRCILEVTQRGVARADHEPSDAERAALAEAIEAADPLCEVRFDLACAACGARVTAGLSVTETVWSELDRTARSLVSEVHQLATAYGWTEAECLALSPARRATYLEWVGTS